MGEQGWGSYANFLPPPIYLGLPLPSPPGLGQAGLIQLKPAQVEARGGKRFQFWGRGKAGLTEAPVDPQVASGDSVMKDA